MSIFIYMNKSDTKKAVKILEEGGYEGILCAENYKQMLDQLHLNEPAQISSSPTVDLFLLDISSDRESIRLCEEIKNDSRYYEVPIIVFSENTAQETFQMAFAYGASDFITKPVRNFEFLTRVRSALKMKHEIDSRRSRERELLEVTRQLSDLNTVLNRLSLIDSLTGIPNRRCFDQSLDQELRLGKRNNHKLSLILIDIDYFKLFNDNYGHQVGDKCLKEVADCIVSCLRRPSDLIARYGGEEFAAILPDTDEKGAKFIAEKIKELVKQLKIEHKGSKVGSFVTISQGYVSFDPLNGDIQASELIGRADKALYLAKQTGRDCIRKFEESQKDLELNT